MVTVVMMKRFLISIVSLSLLGGGGWFFWQRQQEQISAGFDIQTVAVQANDVRRVVSTSGKVKTLVTVLVGSQLSGQITELYADFNSEVKANTVIARIDPRTFETKVHEAQAAAAVATATVSVQEASLEKAKASLINAEREFKRNQSLQIKGSISESLLDNAQAQYRTAQAEVNMAQAQVANAKATLQQRQASLESAQIDLERTFIRAPIDGIVIERNVDVGQTVAASLSAPTLFTIAQDLRKMQINAQVDEADIGQVSLAAPVFFNVDAYPQQKFTGKIEQIRLAPLEAQNVVTYTMVIAADNPNKILLPGMTANVEIVVAEQHGVLTVPNEALRFRPNETITQLLIPAARTEAVSSASKKNNPHAREGKAPDYKKKDDKGGKRMGQVWVLESTGLLAPRAVELGISDDRWTEVLGTTLQVNEQVVVRVRAK